MNTRRNFLSKLAVSAAMPALWCGHALAQTPPPPVKLEESDPVAIALGYKEDTTKVDKVKYPQHKDDQFCEGCLLAPVPKEGDRIACTAFQNKLVSKKGWCMAYAKKPA